MNFNFGFIYLHQVLTKCVCVQGCQKVLNLGKTLNSKIQIKKPRKAMNFSNFVKKSPLFFNKITKKPRICNNFYMFKQ